MEMKYGARKRDGNCMKEEGSMVKAMCGRQLKDTRDLMSMLGLNESIDQLAMANSVHWYSHVLSREDYHLLRKALDFEVEGKRKRDWRTHGRDRLRKER